MIAIAGIHSTTSTDKESGILYLESGIHGVESRIPDCLRFHYYLGQFMNDILQIWTIFLLASFTLIKIQILTTFVRVVSCEKMERLVRGNGEYRKTGRVKKKSSYSFYCVFSDDVMAAIFVSQNNDTTAMFMSQTSPVGVEPFFFYVNAFFCSNKFAQMLAT